MSLVIGCCHICYILACGPHRPRVNLVNKPPTRRRKEEKREEEGKKKRNKEKGRASCIQTIGHKKKKKEIRKEE
ncbi:unnamed protein product [Sphagnum jensenii]|uniref:Secreted protein n=1 Tax=Sphagnum jensenii TaxID=128206 RepID=A0ABP0VUN4_9BRYO